MQYIDHTDRAGRPSPLRMSLAQVDLNLLVALDALLAECHVTRAAERTSVTQSAMSASLGRLRKHFDDQLLVKRGRTLARTPLAEMLVGPVREAVAAVESVMIRPVDFAPEIDYAAFSVMAADYVSMVFLRPLLQGVTSRAPNVRFSLRPIQADFADQLRRGNLDFAIFPAGLSDRVLPFPHQTLFSDRYVVIMDRANPEFSENISAEEMLGLNYVAFNDGVFKPILDTDLEVLQVPLQVAITTQEFVMAPFMLAGTRLASITLERLAVQLADVAGLRILECPLPLRSVTEILYWDARRTEDPAHRWLRQCITTFSRAA